MGLATATLATGGLQAARPDAANAYHGHAHAEAHTWSVVGGDPFVPGGIHSRQEYVNAVTSSRAARLMKLMGLNTAERRAWRKGAREGEEVACEVHTGAHFDEMGFGAGGTSTDPNVTLTDPDFRFTPLKGYCLKLKVPLEPGQHRNSHGTSATSETLHTFVAQACANLAVESLEYRYPHSKPSPHKPPVRVGKVFEDANGNRLPFLPGVARVEWKCGDDGKFRRVVVISSTQLLGRCGVGKQVTVREKDTLGGDGQPQPLAVSGEPAPAGAHWEIVTPQSQTRKQRVQGFLARFKNRQLPVIKPPPVITKPQPNPPHITMLQKTPGFEPPFAGGIDTFCATGDTNRRTDSRVVRFLARFGLVSETFTDPNHPNNDPNSDKTYCATVKEPLQVVSNQNVRVVLVDTQSGSPDFGQMAEDNTGDFATQQSSGF